MLPALLLTLGGCQQQTPPTPTPSPARVATWTPTPTLAPTNTPTRTPALTPPRVRTNTPAPAKTPPTSPTPLPQRIDTAGPIALTTAAPLPRGDGRPPVRLLIPEIGLDIPVKPMGWHVVRDQNGVHSEWDVPDFAAGHHIDSAFPGETGNVVISGHNNIRGAVFAPLCIIGEPDSPLRPGDAIILVDEAGRRFVYRINGWQRVPESNASVALREENASYMLPTDSPQLTLITCWPPQSNTHRVIITAVLTDIQQP